jgi:hypothetical protein
MLAIQGLTLDIEKGNLLRLGRDGYILAACHGTRYMQLCSQVEKSHAALQRKSDLCTAKKETAWPQAQCPHSCLCERFIYIFPVLTLPRCPVLTLPRSSPHPSSLQSSPFLALVLTLPRPVLTLPRSSPHPSSLQSSPFLVPVLTLPRSSPHPSSLGYRRVLHLILAHSQPPYTHLPSHPFPFRERGR